MANTNKAAKSMLAAKVLKLVLTSKVGIPWKIAAGVIVALLAYATGSLDGLVHLLLLNG